MDRIVIYKSRKKSLVIVGSSMLIALAGYLLLQHTGKEVIGWCLLILSVFTLILGIGTFFDRKPKIILTSRGITETSNIREEIEWDAIRQVDEFYYRGQYFIRILVDRNYKPDLLIPSWFYRFDRIYAQQGVRALFIRVSLLDIGSICLSQMIQRMVNADEDRPDVLEFLERSMHPVVGHS
ncbi:MAG: hypothetical protein LUD02_00310 [Tannerellaceae bacterium]|nr:hypothetical protein [Tannerellaceae bacterium]